MNTYAEFAEPRSLGETLLFGVILLWKREAASHQTKEHQLPENDKEELTQEETKGIREARGALLLASLLAEWEGVDYARKQAKKEHEYQLKKLDSAIEMDFWSSISTLKLIIFGALAMGLGLGFLSGVTESPITATIVGAVLAFMAGSPTILTGLRPNSIVSAPTTIRLLALSAGLVAVGFLLGLSFGIVLKFNKSVLVISDESSQDESSQDESSQDESSQDESSQDMAILLSGLKGELEDTLEDAEQHFADNSCDVAYKILRAEVKKTLEAQE